MKFEKVKLKEISSYVTERIETEKVDEENYISTENMVSNKGGKVRASKLPNSKSVIAYKPGDVLISNIRPYFKKIWFSSTIGGSSADVLVIRPNEKVIPDYLYYFLSQDKIFDYMVQTSKGTKMPRGDKQALMDYELAIPNLDIQKNISKFFSNIDKKIEINNSLISNLEELAQTLFKRWFVDFEFPNEEGKPYKSSGGKMVESELGMIPDGWKIKSLSEVANFQNGLAMQKFRPKEDEESLPVLKIKELRQGFTDTNSDLCSINIKDSVKVYDGDVIFSWSATLLVKLWVGGDAGLNQHLFKVTSTDHSKWFYYLWTKHYLDIFNAIAKDKATTMGHIKRSHLDESKVIIPTQKYYDYFDSVFNEIIDQKVNLLKENKSLAELRDTLLPKLLSGEIELPDDLEVTDDVPVS